MAHPAWKRRPLSVTARLIEWRLLCLAGRSVEVALFGGCAKIWLPPEWRGVAKLIYAFREDYEPELSYVRQRLPPGSVVVDVGACYGIWTVGLASALGGRGLVLAFEPAKASFEVLRRNVDRNGMNNVRLFATALGDSCGSAVLHHHADPSRNTLGKSARTARPSETVRLQRLDDVLAEQEIERLDLIKIDVEGAEELVLRGARWSLQRWRPRVVFEVNFAAAAALGLEPTGALQFLKTLNYRILEKDSKKNLRPVYAAINNQNLVAIPQHGQ